MPGAVRSGDAVMEFEDGIGAFHRGLAGIDRGRAPTGSGRLWCGSRGAPTGTVGKSGVRARDMARHMHCASQVHLSRHGGGAPLSQLSTDNLQAATLTDTTARWALELRTCRYYPKIVPYTDLRLPQPPEELLTLLQGPTWPRTPTRCNRLCYREPHWTRADAPPTGSKSPSTISSEV